MNASGCTQHSHSVIIPARHGGGGEGGEEGVGVVQRLSTPIMTPVSSGLIISTSSTTTITCMSEDVGKRNVNLQEGKEDTVTLIAPKDNTVVSATIPLVVPLLDLDALQQVLPLPIPIPKHICEICRENFSSQFKFFEHLKAHYETVATPTSDNCVVEDETQKGPRRKKKKKNTIEADTGNIHIPKAASSSTDPCITDKDIREEIVKLDPCLEDDDLDYDAYLDVAPNDEEETEMMMYLQSNICLSCDEPCETKETLEKHISEVHSDIFKLELLNESSIDTKRKVGPPNAPVTVPAKKPDVIKCQECQRIFNHRNSLVYHMRSHSGERPYKCETCGKSFFATSALKVHMRLHSGIKPYNCNECGRDFRQWGDLKYHKISIHSNERAYQCEFCGKDFARKYSLIVHRRIHTGEKNYKCDQCPKTFRAASYLQNHRRIHTGEKPHGCEICGKPFRVRSDMKRHMASHTKDMKIMPDASSI